MKKYILLLIIPLLSFGQDDYVPQSQRGDSKVKIGENNYKLGEYIKVNYNNIEFQLKKPLAPFEESKNSYSINMGQTYVIGFLANQFTDPIMLSINAVRYPPTTLDVENIFYDKEVTEEFLEGFLGASYNSGMNIESYTVKTINNKNFLEIISTISMYGVTQKQIMWVTFYKKNMINIIGATMADSYKENLSFLKDFSYSVIIK